MNQIKVHKKRSQQKMIRSKSKRDHKSTIRTQRICKKKKFLQSFQKLEIY